MTNKPNIIQRLTAKINQFGLWISEKSYGTLTKSEVPPNSPEALIGESEAEKMEEELMPKEEDEKTD